MRGECLHFHKVSQTNCQENGAHKYLLNQIIWCDKMSSNKDANKGTQKPESFESMVNRLVAERIEKDAGDLNTVLAKWKTDAEESRIAFDAEMAKENAAIEEAKAFVDNAEKDLKNLQRKGDGMPSKTQNNEQHSNKTGLNKDVLQEMAQKQLQPRHDKSESKRHPEEDIELP